MSALSATPPLPSDAELASLQLAQMRHSRRQLHAAVASGIAFLAALGISRSVDGEFVTVDPEAAGDALEDAIEILDALDGDPDLEADVFEDDDLAEDDGTDEPTLGAPERSPEVLSLTHRFHKPANGKRQRRPRNPADSQQSWARGAGVDGEGEPTLGAPECHPLTWSFWQQVHWAQGSNACGEGESEPGYDLPCDDDERDGPEHPDDEPWLGAPENHDAHPNQERWSQGNCNEEADELDPPRPIARRLQDIDADKRAAREVARRAIAIRSAKRAASLAGLYRPWTRYPRFFASRVVGDCCAPEILDGGRIVIDQEAEPKVGDFVCVFFATHGPGGWIMRTWVKRLVSGFWPGVRLPLRRHQDANAVPVLIVESLNPSKRYGLDAECVFAVFKVVEVQPPAHLAAQHVATDFRFNVVPR